VIVSVTIEYDTDRNQVTRVVPERSQGWWKLSPSAEVVEAREDAIATVWDALSNSGITISEEEREWLFLERLRMSGVQGTDRERERWHELRKRWQT